MSVGWVGLIIGCVVAFALLFAVAMGCAAKRGDRQNRRAAERARERVVVTQDFWPRGVLGEIADEIRGAPYDREREPQSVDERLREGFEGMRRSWEEGQ